MCKRNETNYDGPVCSAAARVLKLEVVEFRSIRQPSCLPPKVGNGNPISELFRPLSAIERSRTHAFLCRRQGDSFEPVSRRLRRLQPSSKWFVTTRCVRGEYRLVPEAKRNLVIRLALRRAMEACPGIEVHAFVAMSNHIHLVVTDRDCVLDRFMSRLLGPLARYMNRFDSLSGPVFERRYSAIEILDQGAFIDRLVYTMTNPVAANLVERPEDWPGVLFARIEQGLHDQVAELVRARVADLALERGRKPVLGSRVVCRQRPMDSPRSFQRKRMPLCHFSDRRYFYAYRDLWRCFTRAFKEASHRFRNGDFGARFPDYSFRPWVPILLP